MATAIKKCRVCGKSYEACRSIKRIAGVFRWQEVACSKECGSIYLAKIEESREVKPTDDKDESVIVEYNIPVFDDNYEDEEEFYDELDEYFDDAE